MATTATQTSPEPPGRHVLKREKSDLDQPENNKQISKPKPAPPAEKPVLLKIKPARSGAIGKIYSTGAVIDKPKFRPPSPPKYQRPSELLTKNGHAYSGPTPSGPSTNGSSTLERNPQKSFAKTPVLSARKPLKIDTAEEPSGVVVLQEENNRRTSRQTQDVPVLEYFPPPPPEFSENSEGCGGDNCAVRSKLQLWETRAGEAKKAKPAVPIKPKGPVKLHPNDKTPVDENDIILPPSQEKLLMDVRLLLEFLPVCGVTDAGHVYERCSLVAGKCSSYLEMITPHSRFKLREHLARLQSNLDKLSLIKSSSSSTYCAHYHDLQAVLQDICQVIGK